MATYYVPPPQRAAARLPYHDTSPVDEDQITLLDMQRSIYVFPNPSSAPPSPGGSMMSSIPTDYSGTISSSSRPGSRDHSRSLSSTESPLRGRARATSSAAVTPSSPWRVVRSNPSGRTTSEGGTDLDVEVWDWMAESEGADGNDTWDLEAEVERIGRWGISLSSHNQAWLPELAPHASSASRPLTVAIPHRLQPLHSNDGRFRNDSTGLRSRTQSNTSAVSSSLGSTFSSFRLSAIQSPQPRVHIPLLSFIASFFSLDLDDPALRLLTASNSTSESILFPGHSLFLDPQSDPEELTSPSSEDSDSEGLQEEVRKAEQPHGLLRLLVLSDESRTSIRTLRDGIAVSCSTVLPTRASPFSLPSIGSVFGLCRAVGDACRKSGQALRELSAK